MLYLLLGPANPAMLSHVIAASGGPGARIAMQDALHMASLQASDIDYINLHGTATHSNDAAEGKAVHALFGASTRAVHTKARRATPWALPVA